jgi:hypothetical protein
MWLKSNETRFAARMELVEIKPTTKRSQGSKLISAEIIVLNQERQKDRANKSIGCTMRPSKKMSSCCSHQETEQEEIAACLDATLEAMFGAALPVQANREATGNVRLGPGRR